MRAGVPHQSHRTSAHQSLRDRRRRWPRARGAEEEGARFDGTQPAPLWRLARPEVHAVRRDGRRRNSNRTAHRKSATRRTSRLRSLKHAG